MAENLLTLAVAGSRKTQSIVDACVQSPQERRILVITYTKNNQDELRVRLAKQAGNRSNIEVIGWFAFLIAYFIKPYLPFVFPGKRIYGFDFMSDPMNYVDSQSYVRYFNPLGQGRRPHLAQLAHKIEEASGGQAVGRLGRMFDQIYIDEVQDLCGWDLEILQLLMKGGCPLTMVGDVRQAIIATNPRDRKNKQFMYMAVWDWFRQHQSGGLLAIEHKAETWRCRPEIAAFADSLFADSHGFERTVSRNDKETVHDGVFLVRREHLDAYIDEYRPLFLRYSAAVAKDAPYDFMNIGQSKGMTTSRVLIWPTGAYKNFVLSGRALEPMQAAHLYVAATRAEQSVAFVVDDAGGSQFPLWSPASESLDTL